MWHIDWYREWSVSIVNTTSLILKMKLVEVHAIIYSHLVKAYLQVRWHIGHGKFQPFSSLWIPSGSLTLDSPIQHPALCQIRHRDCKLHQCGFLVLALAWQGSVSLKGMHSVKAAHALSRDKHVLFRNIFNLWKWALGSPIAQFQLSTKTGRTSLTLVGFVCEDP